MVAMTQARRLALMGCLVTPLLVGTAARAQTALPGWELTFDDEFTGSTVDPTKWQKRYKWGEAQVNDELQAYVDDAFAFDGEVLDIVGQHSSGQYAGLTFDYRSGLIASLFHQQYGWFETRCKMPLGQGLWPAFWLLGETGSVGVNEIDILEYLGNDPYTVYMTVHWGTSYTVGHQSDGQPFTGPDFSADYHTFAVDWDADRIIWYVDGVERFRHTGIDVPQVEMYVIANLAIGGTWPGPPDATTVFPANYAIDYIRVYRRLQSVSDAGNTEPADAGVAPADSGEGVDASPRGNTASTNILGPNAGNCGCRSAGEQARYSSVLLALLLGVGGLVRGRRRGKPARAYSSLLALLFSCANSSRAPQGVQAPSTSAKASATPAATNVALAPSQALPAATDAKPAIAELVSKAVPLPGATGPVSLDYIVYDHARERVWVPVADTGSVDVFDIARGAFIRVDGFKKTEREVHGKKRWLGPSAAAVGDGVVYVGNRATGEVCVVAEQTLKLGACSALPTPTDGVAYVAATKEVWVTTPRDQSLTLLDATRPDALKPKLVIKTPGEPEGYAVDEARGLFYTNLEDKDRTLVIDVKTHTIQANWAAGCGDAGIRGIAVDRVRNLVFVACTQGVRVLDGAHDGSLLGKLDVGAGVDNIDYVESNKTLTAAAARVARLTVARVDDRGQLSVIATAATAEGARNAVADSKGNVYLAEPGGAQLLVFDRPTFP